MVSQCRIVTDIISGSNINNYVVTIVTKYGLYDCMHLLNVHTKLGYKVPMR